MSYTEEKVRYHASIDVYNVEGESYTANAIRVGITLHQVDDYGFSEGIIGSQSVFLSRAEANLLIAELEAALRR